MSHQALNASAAQAPPPAAPPQAVARVANPLGRYNTDEGWVLATAKQVYIKDLVIPLINHNFFENVTYANLTTIIYYGRVRMATFGIADSVFQITYAIAESLGPFIPDNVKLDNTRGRARFLADVNNLIPLNNNVSRMTQDIFNVAHARLFALDPAFPDPANGVIDITANAATFEDALNIVRILANHAYATTARQEVLSIYVLMLVSILKQGTATDGFIRKITDGIESELNIVVNHLDLDHIKNVWIQLGSFVNETNIEQLITLWDRVIPADALRLRLTVQQAAGDGLTALQTIKEAYATAVGFPWAEINALLPGEVQKVVDAFNRVGTNRYFGYAKDLGAAKSTNYKNYAWVAKEILIKGFGHNLLSRYRGWIRNPAREQQLSDIIQRYIDATANVAFGAGTAADVGFRAIDAARTACTGV